jgi:hypothetical protein
MASARGRRRAVHSKKSKAAHRAKHTNKRVGRRTISRTVNAPKQIW